jgi:hypothetical protein
MICCLLLHLSRVNPAAVNFDPRALAALSCPPPAAPGADASSTSSSSSDAAEQAGVAAAVAAAAALQPLHLDLRALEQASAAGCEGGRDDPAWPR